jgi:hypothetical protein
MPDLDQLDWAKLKAELEEELRNRKLFSLEDVQRLEQRSELTVAILRIFRPAILALYQKEENGRQRTRRT